MDQRIKNREEEVTLSLIKQQQREKSSGIITEKEEQQQEAREGEEGIEQGREPEAAIRKNQRGQYRQYEDTYVILEKIRSYRTQRYPDSEIMKLLDNMPRRTYYNYVKKLHDLLQPCPSLRCFSYVCKFAQRLAS